jgi:hypothetical protein
MLPDAEHLQPDLLGELRLLEEIAHALLGADGRVRQLAERVDAEFHTQVTTTRRARRVAR